MRWQKEREIKNKVGLKQVTIRHFGIIMRRPDWENIADRLNNKNINFMIKPHTRFEGKIGEQSTLFIKDPSDNYLKFKAFMENEMIFNY